MADLSKLDRTEAAESAYGINDDRSEQVRQRSHALISNVLRNTEGKPRIDRQLAISSVCPFVTKQDRGIWCEVVNELWPVQVDR